MQGSPNTRMPLTRCPLGTGSSGELRMNRTLRILLIAVGLTLAAGGGATEGRPSEPAVATRPQAEVERIVRERLQAAVRGDRSAWRRHISADCVWTGPGLAVGTTADAELEITGNAALPTNIYEVKDFETHMFGKVAVATYVSVERQPDGIGTAKRFRKTDTYLRRGGAWQLISAAEVFVPSRPVLPVDPQVYDSYLGQYSLDASHVVKVWREGDRLLSQEAGEQNASEFLPAGNDSFFLDGEPGDWIFGRTEDGRVNRLIFRLSGADVVLRKIN